MINFENEKFREIKGITESLYEGFQELYQAECKESVNSVVFQNKVNSVKSTLFLEDTLYNNLSNKEILEFLNGTTRNLETELNAISNSNGFDLINFHILEKLVGLTFQKDLIYPPLHMVNAFSYTLMEDYIKTLMRILKIYIGFNEKAKSEFEIVNELIRIKYNTCFVFPFVLDDLIDNNFTINSTLIWNASNDVFTKPLNISTEDIWKYKYGYCSSLVTNSFNLILSFVLKEKIDYKKALLSEIIFRSSILYLGDNTYKEYSDNLTKVINEIKMIPENKEYDFDHILKILSYYQNDREIPITVNTWRK